MGLLDFLFGNGDADKRKKRDAYEAFLGQLSPAKKDLYELSHKFGGAGLEVRRAIASGDDRKLREVLQIQVVPHCSPEIREAIKRIGRSSSWATEDDVIKAGLSTAEWRDDDVVLGWMKGDDGQDFMLTFAGDGHLLTVAPTGMGKGQGHIIPALLDYKGSIVVLDFKGEAYQQTAWYRRFQGKVAKWAPFEKETDAFNPLDFVESWDDARVLADLLVVPSGKSDPFWDSSARDLVTATIEYVRRTHPDGERNMSAVLDLLSPGRDEFEAMIAGLRETGDRNLARVANQLEGLDEKPLSSIYQTARSHLDAWSSPQIARATAFTSEDFSPSNLLISPWMAEMMPEDQRGPNVERLGDSTYAFVVGSSPTIYLTIPPEQLRSFGSVMRVVVGMMLNIVTRTFDELEKERREQSPKDRVRPHCPVLFLLDELPQLGYMSQLENAIAIARASKIRLWLFAQSLAQLETTYPQHATLMENCKVNMFFGLNSLDTAKQVSERVGKVKNLFGEEDLLVSPQELTSSDEYKEHQIVIVQGVKPIRSRLRLYYKDEALLNQHSDIRPSLEEFGDRTNMRGRYTSKEEIPEQLQELQEAAARARAEANQGTGSIESTRVSTPAATDQRSEPDLPQPDSFDRKGA